MLGIRRCFNCGEPLADYENDRCFACVPVLSEHARAVGEVRRREREELNNADRQLDNVNALISKMFRSLK
jgi:hypothetical protein